MHIYVDADACPVIGIVERIAKSHNIAVTLLCDTNHYLTSDYSEVVYVGAGADAVDFKLISLCEKGDLVVTQDYGVAAMALSKGAYAIHQSGKWYTNENSDHMLMERHMPPIRYYLLYFLVLFIIVSRVSFTRSIKYALAILSSVSSTHLAISTFRVSSTSMS